MSHGPASDTAGPVATIPPAVANGIGLVVLDVDGVLTDGGVYIGGDKDAELKRFDIQDGLGIRFLQWAGIEVAIVSGRVSMATQIRAEELDIVECHQDGGAQKVKAIEGILKRKGLDWDQVAMLGDDLPDLAVLKKVGLPAVVANATEEVLRVATWQGRTRGGHGAVREFCEALLKARGEWEEQVQAYERARSGETEDLE
jgi:3-deoxy-D-manno-octulosonate 8-phosphate phosphatase (KDO 8-P phosphatase)